MTKIIWQLQPQFIIFRVLSGDNLVSPDKWSLVEPRLPSGSIAKIAPILTLIENEKAEVLDPEVHVSHDHLAKFNPWELQGVGLPAPMPYTLEIEGSGLVTDQNFRFSFSFIHQNGQVVMGPPELIGCILHVGTKQLTVLDPFYSLIQEIERFNQASHSNTATRMEAVGAIQDLIPGQIETSDYFRNIRVVRSDCFSIKPYMNSNHEVDFDIVPMRRVRNESDNSPTDSYSATSVMPENIEHNWSNRLRQQNSIPSVSIADSGWYLVVPEQVQKALQSVKEQQNSSELQRRNFLKNPQAFLRETLPDVDENVLETIFIETQEFSRRVREVGIWQPKVLPFITGQNEPWLPPVEVGLQIGDKTIPLRKDEISSLIKQVEEALDKGQTEIEHNETKIPVTLETLQALRQLASSVDRSITESVRTQSREKIALLIHDNLEAVDYLQEIRPFDGKVGDLPKTIKTNLLPHQLEGYEWLQQLWISGSHGGLLADDMGLGKTLQTLAFLTWLREQPKESSLPLGPILIVAPTGLLKNWIAEHETHFHMPGLGEPLEAHGAGIAQLRIVNASRDKETLTGFPALDTTKLRNSDWVLTSYETLRDYQHSFGGIHWSAVVLDEAQKVKNPTTITTDAVKAINADIVIALTGTPVENRLAELWTIVDTVRPGVLGSLKEFTSRYETENVAQEGLKELKEQLTTKSTPAVLKRRMKEDHLKGLPVIRFHKEERIMPLRQSEAFQKAVERARSGTGLAQILRAIQEFRTLSLHPGGQYTEKYDSDFINDSARMQCAFDVLDHVHKLGQKALVFLDDLSVQGYLADIIQRRFSLENSPLIINGLVAGPKRKERVDKFQNRVGFDVMLLSPRAGGVGITLTAANHVIHLARWWNPAVEDQCTDRVYRIGQTNEVHVYLPMAIHPQYGENSFDYKLDHLLERKRTLSRSVLAPVAHSEKDLLEMYQDITSQ